MQVGFTLGPAIGGLALKWLDLRTDIAATTVLLVFAVPGALLVSQTRQHTGQGLSLRDAALDLVHTFGLEPAPRPGTEKRNG